MQLNSLSVFDMKDVGVQKYRQERKGSRRLVGRVLFIKAVERL